MIRFQHSTKQKFSLISGGLIIKLARLNNFAIDFKLGLGTRQDSLFNRLICDETQDTYFNLLADAVSTILCL